MDFGTIISAYAAVVATGVAGVQYVNYLRNHAVRLRLIVPHISSGQIWQGIEVPIANVSAFPVYVAEVAFEWRGHRQVSGTSYGDSNVELEPRRALRWNSPILHGASADDPVTVIVRLESGAVLMARFTEANQPRRPLRMRRMHSK